MPARNYYLYLSRRQSGYTALSNGLGRLTRTSFRPVNVILIVTTIADFHAATLWYLRFIPR